MYAIRSSCGFRRAMPPGGRSFAARCPARTVVSRRREGSQISSRWAPDICCSLSRARDQPPHAHPRGPVCGVPRSCRFQSSLSGGGYAGASAETAVVGASAPDVPAKLFLNGLPHCEQNGAARSTSEPHCWHRSICNGSADHYRMLPRLEVPHLQTPAWQPRRQTCGFQRPTR